MANLTAEEKKDLKFKGIIATKNEGEFIARMVAPCGVFTNEQMQLITETAKKYGSGSVAFTSRLTAEIQGVSAEDADAIIKAAESVGLVTGGTGAVVRPVVACKGTVCVHGLVDTQKFATRIFNEFYLGWHNIKLPHKFKIGVGGCPNNCIKPAYNDFGIMAQRVPETDSQLCRSCKKCAVIEKCPVHAATQNEDGTVTIDKEKCTNCGKCIDACYFGSVKEKDCGFKVFIGGIFGKTQRPGTPVPGLYSEDEVMKLIEKALLLFREQGVAGERLGRTVDRVGVDKFIEQLLSDDVLARKNKILGLVSEDNGQVTC